MIYKRLLLGVFLAVLSLNVFSQSTDARSQGAMMRPTQGLTESPANISKKYKDNQSKNAKIEKISLFATSYSFMDSTMFVSQIEIIDSAVVKNKVFLSERAYYEEQFKNFIEAKGNNPQVSIVYFSKNDNKLKKKYQKIQKLGRKKSDRNVVLIGDEFSFVSEK